MLQESSVKLERLDAPLLPDPLALINGSTDTTQTKVGASKSKKKKKIYNKKNKIKKRIKKNIKKLFLAIW